VSFMIVGAIAAVPVLLASYLTSQWPMLIIVSFIFGFNGGMSDISLRVLLGFVTDEDQLVATKQGRDSSNDPSFIAPRRDGLFWSAWTLAEVFAGFYIGVGTVVFGMAGLDGKLDTQPQSAVWAIALFILCVATLNYVLSAFVMLQFPLKGKRLAEVQEEYEQLFRAVEKSTSVRRATSKTPGPESSNGSKSVSIPMTRETESASGASSKSPDAAKPATPDDVTEETHL